MSMMLVCLWCLIVLLRCVVSCRLLVLLLMIMMCGMCGVWFVVRLGVVLFMLGFC